MTRHTRQSYPGGKAGAGVFQRLINLMPAHTTYIECFLGHGALLLHKHPAHHNIGLDLDPQAVKIVYARLTAGIASSVLGGSEYAHHDDAADTPPLTRGQHRQYDISCSTHEYGDDAGAAFTLGPARYQLLVGDGIDFLRSYAFTGSELAYCDPPYVRSTRRTRARLYRHEMDDCQHTQLLAVLRRLPCAVMVSGYRSPLYTDQLHGWRPIEYQAMTRGGLATEVVWMNYSPPTALHDYTHLGANFRERERQKRQQRRWAEKVAAKPLLEQKALLAGLLRRVGPTVSAEVLRSALAHFGDESRIASQGPSGSPHVNHNEAGLRQEQRASRCTICRSPARQRIDQALASGVSVRDVARQEALSKSVVGRHRDHGLGHAVSHFQRPISGTGDTGHHQGQTTRSVQLDLLSLAAEREDPA